MTKKLSAPKLEVSAATQEYLRLAHDCVAEFALRHTENGMLTDEFDTIVSTNFSSMFKRLSEYLPAESEEDRWAKMILTSFALVGSNAVEDYIMQKKNKRIF